jgi:signal transduction histidine kinase
MLVLLVFASFEAYRIQEKSSGHHLDLFHRYAQQDEAMNSLRSSVVSAGSRVREYLIDSRPENAVKLAQQLKELREEADRALIRLEQLQTVSGPAVSHAIPEFWAVLESVAITLKSATPEEKYTFVQEEIVPRRSQLSIALREVLVASQVDVQQREREIADSRRVSGRRLVLVLGICMALALAVARFSVTHSDGLERASQRQYEELASARQELRELSARLVDIEEDGRKRLARELHDGLGQSLAILQIEISNLLTLPPERLAGSRERLVRARELAQATVQSVRSMSLTLRPALLDDLGLVPALHWMLEDFMRRSGVHCELKTADVDDQLNDPVKTCVYRILQEAIHNCEKHAAATRVTVTIKQSPVAITAEVQDNGHGFNVEDGVSASRRRGLGIVVMRERAERLNGTLVIESSPGGGTRLRVSVPVTQTGQPQETPVATVKT